MIKRPEQADDSRQSRRPWWDSSPRLQPERLLFADDSFAEDERDFEAPFEDEDDLDDEVDEFDDQEDDDLFEDEEDEDFFEDEEDEDDEEDLEEEDEDNLLSDYDDEQD